MQRRKFNPPDAAVSPVVGTIILVAIAVVLASSVYVWASGAGSSTPEPAKSLTVTSSTPILAGVKEFAVASATPGVRWSELSFTLDGTPLAYDGALGDDNDFCVAAPGMTCIVGTTTPTAIIGAGDTIRVQHGSMAGKTLRVVDLQANVVILALTLR